MTTNPPTKAQTATESDTIESKNKNFSFKWLILLLALVALCLNGLYFLNFNGSWGNQADFGAFGDFLGGVLNPVLGFATVGLLIWSLKMQMEELSLSRKELAETKNETALSRKAMENQFKHLQNEAKLNEILKLMATISQKSDNKLKCLSNLDSIRYNLGPFKDPEKGCFDISLKDLSYHEVIYNIPSTLDKEENDFFSQRLQNYYEKPNSLLKDIEKLLCQYSNLALKYYEINESAEFATVYLREASEKLHPFHSIFQTEQSGDLLGKLIPIISHADNRFYNDTVDSLS